MIATRPSSEGWLVTHDDKPHPTPSQETCVAMADGNGALTTTTLLQVVIIITATTIRWVANCEPRTVPIATVTATMKQTRRKGPLDEMMIPVRGETVVVRRPLRCTLCLSAQSPASSRRPVGSTPQE